MSTLSPEGFNEFWTAYPRRQAKKDALKAWRALKPSVELVAMIVQHIIQRQHTRQWREGFIPLPATFLRGERWEDELLDESRLAPPLGKVSERMAAMVRRARE